MEHQSLTAQITSKGKKAIENFEPTFFSEIPYSNVVEINYLRDLEEKKKNIDFPIFQFEKDFGQEAPVNEYDMLANTLYKKIMQQGYIQQKKAPSKRKKKNKNPFEYDYEDAWINDEEAITVKKNIYAKFENFRSLNQGVDQFYQSEIYKSNIAQIQQLSKKRPNEIPMDAQKLEMIKKKIKENISMAHNKIKQEFESQKPNTTTQNIEQKNLNVKTEDIGQIKFQQTFREENEMQNDQPQKNVEVSMVQDNLNHSPEINENKTDQKKTVQKIKKKQKNTSIKQKKSESKIKNNVMTKNNQTLTLEAQITEKIMSQISKKKQQDQQKNVVQGFYQSNSILLGIGKVQHIGQKNGKNQQVKKINYQQQQTTKINEINEC